MPVTLLVAWMIYVSTAAAEVNTYVTPKIPAWRITKLRTHVNAVRHAKCLPTISYRWSASRVPAGWRKWVIVLWTRRHLKAHEIVNRCNSVSTGRVGHLSGWLCIHAREGAWNSNTGNGYYGGLQMTYGWMGLVGRADLLSPAQQMAAAEEGYRRSGYSSAWMSGQWPNTYPPCAGLF